MVLEDRLALSTMLSRPVHGAAGRHHLERTDIVSHLSSSLGARVVSAFWLSRTMRLWACVHRLLRGHLRSCPLGRSPRVGSLGLPTCLFRDRAQYCSNHGSCTVFASPPAPCGAPVSPALAHTCPRLCVTMAVPMSGKGCLTVARVCVFLMTDDSERLLVCSLATCE